MTTINLTQPEADALFAMDKCRIDHHVWVFPQHGGSISIPLTSSDKREHFTLDVGRSMNI